MGRFTKEQVLECIHGNLIVSCQAEPGEPFFGSDNIVRFAKAALNGGACAIRANTVCDVKAVSDAFNVPVLSLIKRDYDGNECYITPTFKEVNELVEIGADVVAVDGTLRKHPEGFSGDEFIARIKKRFPELIIMADIATAEEGIAAEKAGADIVSTTLSGYTSQSPKIPGPDFELIKTLSAAVKIPVIGEGRIWTVEEYNKVFECGAYSAVIGSAITRPHEITARFVKSRNNKN